MKGQATEGASGQPLSRDDLQPGEDLLQESDLKLLSQLARIHVALVSEHNLELHRLLENLERSLIEHLHRLRSQARAVADANARGIEIMEQQSALAQQLAEQNTDLRDQAARIETAQQELETQARSLADANVDAVLAAEVAKQEADQISSIKDDLLQHNTKLQSEAQALAAANVEAVSIMEERENVLDDLQRQAVTLREEQRVLEEQAFKDVLTGLFNHRYFKEQMEIEHARAARYHRTLSLVLFDIDHFKLINDTHGHVVGDRVLGAIGAMISNMVRTADITIRMTGKPFAVRYGGEEFVLILPETDLEGAMIAAERVRRQIAATPLPGGETQPGGAVTLSGGVATLDTTDGESVESVESLVKRADEALYRAKRGGRNHIARADPLDTP